MSIAQRAAATNSSAVFITRGGEPLIDWTDDGGHRRVETMSVTKMVVATIVGASLCANDRALLDVSVARWLPEWKDDERSAISLRLLLGHRSGLRCVAPMDFVDVHDSYAAALELPLEGRPTEAFVYNNLAINLAGLVVKRAFGESIVDVAQRLIFRPLGFRDWDWVTDGAGNPRCHFGLVCRADDLAKIGRLYLEPDAILPAWWPQRAMDSGLSCYAQVAWIRAAVTSGLAEQWREAGVDGALIDELTPILDREMEFDEIFGYVARLLNEVRSHGLKEWNGTSGPIVGHGHDGDGGQRIVVYPDLGGVAVRLRENLDDGSMWTSFPGDAQEVLKNAVR